jgi:hypothetical protein
MRLIFGSIAALLLGILWIGCNTVSPDECWINTSGGFGGSGTIPIGAGVGATSGDFLSSPPRGPLDHGEAPNPCIEPPSPCNEKCLANYEGAAIACGKIENEAQRKACADGAYAAYKSCHENCQQMSRTCTDMYVACMDKGIPCTRHIEWKKSLCAICQNDCQANRPYKYSECYKCGFE